MLQDEYRRERERLENLLHGYESGQLRHYEEADPAELKRT